MATSVRPAIVQAATASGDATQLALSGHPIAHVRRADGGCMNVLRELVEVVRADAASLREGCTYPDGHMKPEDAAEVEHIENLVRLAEHALTTLGIE